MPAPSTTCNLFCFFTATDLSQPEDGLAAYVGAGVIAGNGNQLSKSFRFLALREPKDGFAAKMFIGVIFHVFAENLESFLASLHSQPAGHPIAAALGMLRQYSRR